MIFQITKMNYDPCYSWNLSSFVTKIGTRGRCCSRLLLGGQLAITIVDCYCYYSFLNFQFFSLSQPSLMEQKYDEKSYLVKVTPLPAPGGNLKFFRRYKQWVSAPSPLGWYCFYAHFKYEDAITLTFLARVVGFPVGLCSGS